MGGCLLFVIYGIVALVSVITIIADIGNGDFASDGYIVQEILAIAILVGIVIHVRLWYKYNDLSDKLPNKEKRLEEKYNQRNQDLENEYKSKFIDLSNKTSALYDKEVRLKELLKSSIPFKRAAQMQADIICDIFEDKRKHMLNKIRPAKTSAEDVRLLKREVRQYVSELKEMRYKYEFLLNTFPEIGRYIDDDMSLVSICGYDNVGDFKADYDYALNYLSNEEYGKLSGTERNQLALERYIVRQKTEWEAGIEYEMYVEYLLRNKGYYTVPFGSLKKLNDLGRDIIALKDDEALIIQCKRWSAKNSKEIHENTICQLYGTTIAYKLEEDKSGLFNRIIPILVTTGRLSDTAARFSKYLGVEVWVCRMGDFPRIKCNINKGQKIYHLPFDQQYYTTRINEDAGEFYAWSVAEAESKGFRRAMKHQFNTIRNG